MTVKPIPEGYHTLTPYLMVEGSIRLLDFLENAFDATVIFRMDHADSSIRHAELRIGDSMLMLSEAKPDYPGTTAMYYLYLPDVDAAYAKALAAGATSVNAPVDQYYGDRSAGVEDPCGNLWWLATHIEDVSAEEIARREARLST